MHPCAVIPAYQCAGPVGAVVSGALEHLPRAIVVDDGSSDGTGSAAREAGAIVLRHGRNRGKGASLVTGLLHAATLGHGVAVSIDADGQHDPADIPALLAVADPRALVLGVRDLVGAGAPRANVFSNGVSNFFLSRFTGVQLADTQCGMRRYPVRQTLALGLRGRGYELEAEVLVRARWASLPIVCVPISVTYPALRTTHFRIHRDVPRIIATVLATEAERGGRERARAIEFG